MSIKTADNSFEHLYPDFREKLRATLEATAKRTGYTWVMAEGYRSPERQLYLYAQGRTRPGKVVTWMRSPKWHGTGLAADCYPSRNGRTPDFSIGAAAYRVFREEQEKHGLSNPVFGKGDLGHVQLSDERTRQKALAWVRAGFPAVETPHPPAEVPVFVNDALIHDADAFLREGVTYAALRPLTDALDWVIASFKGRIAVVVDDEREASLVAENRGGRGFVAVRELEKLGAVVGWDGAVRITG